MVRDSSWRNAVPLNVVAASRVEEEIELALAIMSSVYNSRRSSLNQIIVREPSKSAPQTPAKQSHKPTFRTVPDSPKHCRLLSDDHGLDLEVLTHKLQLYQLELEEAELRFRARRMINKEAADVAAAARFRNELDKKDLPTIPTAEKGEAISHVSGSVQMQRLFPNRTSSLRALNMVRSKRPNPLLIAAASDVAPQEIQSAALPPRRQILSQGADENKRHWRRTTISAGRNTGSKIITMSSPGHYEEHSFDIDIPPVPELSASASSITSPPTMSPMTPQLTEDQIRRVLETFALEEGPDIRMSRRSSVASRRKLPAAYVPDPEDRMTPKTSSSTDEPIVPPIALPTPPDESEMMNSDKVELARKKSFFSRFERKNDVDALLDLYMTDQQLHDQKTEKKMARKSRRQTFFKRWQSSESLTQKSPKPG